MRMGTQRIDAHKITKPISLMVVWFLALVALDSGFLIAAGKIQSPPWTSPLLVVAAVSFVPIFLLGVFLMQTVFREELQDDRYYSEWLKRQEETFRDFDPENLADKSVEVADGAMDQPTRRDVSIPVPDLEMLRIDSYKNKDGLFLVHSWRPSLAPGQLADIVIWLHQHREGPLSRKEVEKVEYQLGPMFFQQPKLKTNTNESFRLEVSAYGPMLCLARVYIKGRVAPLLLERYINFEEAPNKALQQTNV